MLTHSSDLDFPFARLNLEGVTTPIHITDEISLENNLKILAQVRDQTQVRILMALKAFAQFSLFPLIKCYLQGATSSSLFEARLAREELGGEVHACAPAFPPADFQELLEYIDHIVFNSFQQWYSFQENIRLFPKKIGVGLRINPEHSEVKTALYDPCALGSRLGVRFSDFTKEKWQSMDGLHFHTLCELGSDALKRTWETVDRQFNKILPEMNWINLGGGHHITRPGYNIDLLCETIFTIQKKYEPITVYLEPGEAIALNSGVLIASVLDIVSGGKKTIPAAILDTSAAAHMPDVLEMPYQPEIFSNGSWASDLVHNNGSDKKKYNYRLGGLTCLAGDIIGDYSFAEPLSIGQKLIFTDMSHYTMVKNTNFNGVRPPSIAIGNTQTGKVQIVKKFQYQDYKSRLS